MPTKPTKKGSTNTTTSTNNKKKKKNTGHGKGNSKGQDKIDESVPPMEMSKAEYRELQEQVRGLQREEAEEELLECARYGDLDPVRALLETFPDTLHTAKTKDGSTAMHMASANGHAAIVRLLFLSVQSSPDKTGKNDKSTTVEPSSSSSPYSLLLESNDFGNTPLHWAAANGHPETIKVILQYGGDNVDVLRKNNAGRSALTEGFSSSNTEVAKLLLEHDSASEDKLLQGSQPVNGDDDGGADQSENNDGENDQHVEHDFVLVSKNDKAPTTKTNLVLKIRELPISNADDPFGDPGQPQDDTTGYGIWSASLILARWIVDQFVDDWKGKTVLELGAGCGVPGLAAAVYGQPASVVVTDLNPKTVDNLRHNVELNQRPTEKGPSTMAATEASVMDWTNSATWPTPPASASTSSSKQSVFDVVIGSDLVYSKSVVPMLLSVLDGVEAGTFLYCAPDTDRDGLKEFLERLIQKGWRLVKQIEANDSYKESSLDDEEVFFLHFPEMAATTYILYHFER